MTPSCKVVIFRFVDRFLALLLFYLIVCCLHAVIEDIKLRDNIYNFHVYFVEGVVGAEEVAPASFEPKNKKRKRKIVVQASSNLESSNLPIEESILVVAPTDALVASSSPALNPQNISSEQFCNEFALVDAAQRHVTQGKYVLTSSSLEMPSDVLPMDCHLGKNVVFKLRPL